MRRIAVSAAGLVISLVLALTTPGHADSLDDKSTSDHAKRTAAAAKLDAAKPRNPAGFLR